MLSTIDLPLPLVGNSTDRTVAVVTPPAPGWRQTPGHLIRREINRLRSRKLTSSRELVRWGASPGLRPRFPRLRQYLLAGAIYVDLPSDSPARLIRAGEHFEATDDLRTGSGGGLRQFGVWHNTPALLRLGVIDTPGDPTRHFRALELIDRPEVPAALASGTIDDVRWTIESVIDGSSVNPIPLELIEQVDSFLAGLPRSSEPIDSIGSSVAVLSSAGAGDDVVRVGNVVAEMASTLPATFSHGDLWSGNLLFHKGRLAGVIDWDSWLPRAVPGTDLLHLKAEEIRRKRGVSYGELVIEEFWAAPEIADMTARHLRGLDVAWDERLQATIGRAWWLAATAGALRRSPALANDDEWMARNVVNPGHRIADGVI